jgi:pyridoxine 5-phosphate synthase
MAKLGVNIDHVATIRQARRTNEPDPVWAAALAELGGADGITFHLREDRRHIQDRDARLLRETVAVPINLELACTEEVLDMACDIRPHTATLVPERREEVTTEGGLDVVAARDRVRGAIERLHAAGITVSLFLDPDIAQIDIAQELRADAVELHTGRYAHAASAEAVQKELATLRQAAERVVAGQMTLHAGHGLTYRNVQPIAALANMSDLNIGHSIISRAVLVGLEQAVRDMRALITAAAR